MIIGHFSIYCGKPRAEGICKDPGIFRGKLNLFLGKVKSELILITSIMMYHSKELGTGKWKYSSWICFFPLVWKWTSCFTPT